jgi:inner membrane protein involved in colicin E2 resistance
VGKRAECDRTSAGCPVSLQTQSGEGDAGTGRKLERREVEETAIGAAYFLPESLKIDGDVQTQMLHRGIYDAAVFRAQVNLSGNLRRPILARSRST